MTSFFQLNTDIPKSVSLVEVGPRDGFQFESRVVPTAMKVTMVRRLVAAGVRHVQVAAFVHPRRVPQMADAEDLIRALPSVGGVSYSGLVLNARGLERAMAVGLDQVEVSVSASDTHSRRNAGMPAAEALAGGVRMVETAKSAGLFVRASVQCAFGCAYEGEIPADRVVQAAEAFLSAGVDSFSLADTTGMGHPRAVDAMLDRVLPVAGAVPVALHLHDTRGLGLVNVMTALNRGIRWFDTAFGGMGGCPFVPGAAGNIATEDTVHLLSTLGVESGIDPEPVAACSREMETFFGTTFSGKFHHLVPGPVS